MTLSPPPGADGVRLTKAQRRQAETMTRKVMQAVAMLTDAQLYFHQLGFPNPASALEDAAYSAATTVADLDAALSTPPKENDR